MESTDSVLRAITDDGAFRVIVARTTDTIQRVLDAQGAQGVTARHLGDLVTGAVLFPGLHLPLHIFEPRYSAMVQEVLARDRQIGMIQPRVLPGEENREPPALYDVGCVGRIVDVEALDEGRFNLVLEGVARFRVRQVTELHLTFLRGVF